MKYYSMLFIFSTFLFISSCHLDELIAFDIDYDSEATIPSIIGVNLPFEIPIPPITTNINKKLENKNSKKDYLHSAKLHELTITAIDPSNQNFGFIKNIEIFIDAEGLDKIKIAEKLNIPENVGSKLTLDVFDDKEIAEYLKKDELKLKIKATSRKITLHSIKVNIYSVFRVKADVF